MHHFTLNGGGRAGGQGGARVCWGPWPTGRREGSRSRPFWRRGNSIHYSTRRRRPSTAGARVLGLRNTPAHRPYRPASPLLSLTRSGSSSDSRGADQTRHGTAVSLPVLGHKSSWCDRHARARHASLQYLLARAAVGNDTTRTARAGRRRTVRRTARRKERCRHASPACDDGRLVSRLARLHAQTASLPCLQLRNRDGDRRVRSQKSACV